MTREEARERIRQNKAAAEFYAGQSRITAEIENALKDSEAFEMAIEALTYKNLKKPNNTCEVDLISRVDAIEAVAQQWLFEASVGNPYVNDDDIGEYRKLAEELFEDVPSAEAEWIPCSERLPIPPTFCLVTTDGSHGDVIDIALYMSDGWHKASEVIAWMPLPKPYREDGEV